MKKYSVKNIKAFKDEAEIEIKPITIFVGKNSCGKSSLIRFPVVISQSVLSDADTPILFFGKNIDYGNYEDVVYGHSKDRKMEFSVSYDFYMDRYYGSSNKLDERYSKFIGSFHTADIRIGLTKYSKRMIIDNWVISIEGKIAIKILREQKENYIISFYDIWDDKEVMTFPVKHAYFYHFFPNLYATEYLENIIDYYCKQNGKPLLSNIIKKEYKKNRYGIREFLYGDNRDDNEDVAEIRKIAQMFIFYSDVLSEVRVHVTQDADETYYIGPFRENPSRVYRDVERQVDSVGSRGEDVSAMLKNDYTHGKKVITSVSNWFEKSMNYKVSLKDIGSGLYNIVVMKDDGHADNIIDVGYGISQVLPIVAQLAKIRHGRKRYNRISPFDPTNRTFVIEQPELHLHPGAQAELANLFVDIVSQNNKENSVDILIETHSEHLIRRLQALVADKNVNISNDQVKIYYVDKDENNEAFVTEMRILENGQFEKEWPSGFFDKAYELSKELMRNNIR